MVCFYYCGNNNIVMVLSKVFILGYVGILYCFCHVFWGFRGLPF